MTDTEADEMRQSRGVVGCLTAGFEMLPQNLQVVALPVVLDLVLWLGPRVSVEPLLHGVSELLAGQPPTSPEMVGQVEEAVRLLEQFGGRFNLVSVLGNVPLFHLPSLLARRAPAAGSPLGMPRVISLSSLLALIPWWILLSLVGLMLGFLYLNEIAHQVGDVESLGLDEAAEADDDDQAVGADSIRAGVWRFLRFLSFALGLTVVGSAALPLWMLMVTLATLIAQPLGILVWVGGVGLLSYTAMHLLFVIPSLLVGGRRLLHAISESILLSHVNLSSVLGFTLLAVVIYEGLGYAWSLPRSDSWAMLIGVIGNAFVATGLTGAAFVFYRDRVMLSQRLMAEGE